MSLVHLKGKNTNEEPVKTTCKYHKGFSTAFKVNGTEVILTAATVYDLQLMSKKIMGSICFNLDVDLIDETVVFGVEK